MQKQYAVKGLNKIKEIQETHQKLYQLGVQLVDLPNGIELIEESIALLLSKDEASFFDILNDVQWWLDEDVQKVIRLQNGTEVELEEAEEFVDWLVDWHKLDETKKDECNNKE